MITPSLFRLIVHRALPIVPVAGWAFLAVACVSSRASAQHSHGGDVEVFAEANELLLSRNFVEAEFESDDPGTLGYYVDAPGFTAEKEPPLFETPLPDGALFGFDVGVIELSSASRSLWFWDGGDGVTPPASSDWIASPHELRISHGSSGQSIQVDGASSVAGFWFAQADASDDEVLHAHLTFTLVDSLGDAVVNPAAGVYLFKTTHRAEDAGTPLAGNPELYWIAGMGVDESMHELAVDFVVDQFGLQVPEPGATALAGVALTTLAPLAWRKRRRSGALRG